MQFTKDFEEILLDIFTKHDEKNVRTVPDIMKRFRQNKAQVILHLCDRYNIDVNALDGVDMSSGPAAPVAAAPGGDSGSGEGASVAEGEEAAEGGEEGEEAPKKKSKVLMSIIIVVVVAGLVVCGYFAYDMFMGGGSADTEEAAPEETPAEEAAPEPEPESQPEVVDTSATDSTATDSTAAEGDAVEDAEGDGSE